MADLMEYDGKSWVPVVGVVFLVVVAAIAAVVIIAGRVSW